MVIDVDKFVASLIKYYCEAHSIDRTSIRCWFDDALEEQGLEYKDGKIVKTQRRIADKAKEAIFNDDEKIRKNLIEFIESVFYLGRDANFDKWGKADCSDWIAWLEKQKDTNVLIQEASEKAYTEGMRVERKHWLEKQDDNLVKNGYTDNKDFIKYADNYSHEIWHKLMDNFKNIKDYYIGCNDVSDIVLNAIIDTCNWLEKQGDKKTAVVDFNAKDWYVSKVDGKIHDMTYNPTDKIEPKFKVGDWVVTDKNDITQIKAVNSGYYTIDNGMDFNMSYVDKYWHLWGIQDAKDGDVLVNGSNIFIFHFINGTRLMGYCHVNTDDGRFYDDIGKNECFCLIDAIVNPATKEQCDLLFQKMKETGYEWNAEKKELKKINSYCQENCKGYQETGKCFTDGGCDAKHKAEQESTTWSDRDEENLNGVVGVVERREMTAVSEQYKDILHEYVRWLKSLKDKLQPQPKTTWSEEDEKMSHTIIADFKSFKHDNTSTLESHFNECIDWLKSLKDRLS